MYLIFFFNFFTTYNSIIIYFALKVRNIKILTTYENHILENK